MVASYQSRIKENALFNYISGETLTKDEIRYVQTILYSEFDDPHNTFYLCLIKFKNIDGEIDIATIKMLIETQALFPDMFYFQCSDTILGMLFDDHHIAKNMFQHPDPCVFQDRQMGIFMELRN